MLPCLWEGNVLGKSKLSKMGRTYERVVDYSSHPEVISASIDEPSKALENSE